MPQWSDIQQWQPGPLEETTSDLKTQRETLLNAAEDIENALGSLHSSGQAVTAMRQKLQRRLRELDKSINNVSELMMATADAADGVHEVQTLVKNAQRIAEQYDLSLKPDGGVQWEWKLENVDDFIFHRGKVEDATSSAVAAANRVDTDYTSRLQAVANGTYVSRETHRSNSPGLPDMPPEGASAKENATWWHSLSEDEKKRMIQEHPDVIGNLDGVDAASRSTANKQYLENMINELEQKPDKSDKDRELLSELHKVDEVLNSNKNYNLLTLDPSGDRLKAAVSIGDVDKAAHVATFVPGRGTNINDSLADYAASTDNIRDKMIHNGGGKQSDYATVAWLGYDAPQGGFDPSVIGTGKAEAGADRLSSFCEGIHESRKAAGGENWDPHMTVLGHSYGSTTSGLAAKQVNEGVIDDMVLFGSPGSGAQSTDEYNIPPGHMYVSGVPEGDAVQGMGTDHNFGKNPMKMDGFTHLSNDATGWSGYKKNPGIFDPFANHSSYWQENTQTLNDMADVAAGNR